MMLYEALNFPESTKVLIIIVLIMESLQWDMDLI